LQQPIEKVDKVSYKASGSLILSGSLRTKAQAKCYHALLVLSQLKKWKYDDRGMMRVTVGELHRLTRHACGTWQEYRDTLNSIRTTAELDWGALSELSNGRFARSGKVSVLSEVHVDLDLIGEAKEVVFRIPQDLLEDVIRPSWYGQADPAILFRQRSNYAFHAYLYACLTVIEKDASKDTFFSPAYSMDQWRDILGVEEGINTPPNQFRRNIFRRVEEQIKKTTEDTETPLEIQFFETKKRSKLYQMRVKRLPKPRLEDRAPEPAAVTISEDERGQLFLKHFVKEIAAYLKSEKVTDIDRDMQQTLMADKVSLNQFQVEYLISTAFGISDDDPRRRAWDKLDV